MQVHPLPAGLIETIKPSRSAKLEPFQKHLVVLSSREADIPNPFRLRPAPISFTVAFREVLVCSRDPTTVGGKEFSNIARGKNRQPWSGGSSPIWARRPI